MKRHISALRAIGRQQQYLELRFPPIFPVKQGICGGDRFAGDCVLQQRVGVAGSFDALGLAKHARNMFEQAGKIDYKALDGAVPTSLGALYYMVPGFLLGFGDNDKARHYLQEAIAISPNGLDSNFFYGDFLYRQGGYAEAKKALARGLTAPVHADRPVWDAGRRAEMRALLAKVNEKLASND